MSENLQFYGCVAAVGFFASLGSWRDETKPRWLLITVLLAPVLWISVPLLLSLFLSLRELDELKDLQRFFDARNFSPSNSHRAYFLIGILFSGYFYAAFRACWYMKNRLMVIKEKDVDCE